MRHGAFFMTERRRSCHPPQAAIGTNISHPLDIHPSMCYSDCSLETGGMEMATVNPHEAVAVRDIWYDYKNQAWVVDGRYQRCGHLKSCSCYGLVHEGEIAEPTLRES